MPKRQQRKTGRTLPRLRANSRQFAVLEDISMGDLFVGCLASARSTRTMYRIARERAVARYRNRLAIERLKARGFVREGIVNESPAFFVTPAGKKALEEVYTQIGKAHRQRDQWDGKWRIISYDFPEELRSKRNSLRYILTQAKFRQIQKSVWVSPFDSNPLHRALASDRNMHACVVFMIASTITDEESLRQHFDLKKPQK